MEVVKPILSSSGIGGLLALFSWISKNWLGRKWFSPPRNRRMELLDRVALTHQHSVHLLSVEGRWLAIAVTPKGVELLESGALVSIEPLAAPDPSSVAKGPDGQKSFRLDLELAARTGGCS